MNERWLATPSIVVNLVVQPWSFSVSFSCILLPSICRRMCPGESRESLSSKRSYTRHQILICLTKTIYCTNFLVYLLHKCHSTREFYVQFTYNFEKCYVWRSYLMCNTIRCDDRFARILFAQHRLFKPLIVDPLSDSWIKKAPILKIVYLSLYLSLYTSHSIIWD